MINCVIVDDEQHAIDVLLHYIKQTPFLHLAGATTNPSEALVWINEGKVDLIFLDIHMPEISGIEFAKVITGKCKIIFTTAYGEFALLGYEMEVVDYLMKPIPFPRFMQSVQRVLYSKKTALVPAAENLEDDYIFVKTETKGKMLKVNLIDVDYIEGMKNYVAIYHSGTKTIALLNMRDLEERLPAKYFMRIHKSFIVAINKITAIEGNLVLLGKNKAHVQLGETYKAEFMKVMKEKLMDR
jgi:two-component system LytT family response regulator